MLTGALDDRTPLGPPRIGPGIVFCVVERICVGLADWFSNGGGSFRAQRPGFKRPQNSILPMNTQAMVTCQHTGVAVHSIVLALGVVSVTTAVHATSFDCAKATTAVEKSVCSHDELSRLDDEMNRAYLDARQVSSRSEASRINQLKWVSRRNACASQDCIRDAYGDRIATLQQVGLSTTGNAAVRGAQRAGTKPRYTMHSGRGWAVCEAYVRSLNLAPANEGAPLCDLKLDRVPGITAPAMEELPIAGHLPLVHEIELIVGVGHITPAPAKDFVTWREQFERRAADGQKPRLHRYRGALSPGGPIETVLLYDVDQRQCARQVEGRHGHDLAGSYLLLFDTAQGKVLPRNLGTFYLGPHEIRLYNNQLYAFEVSVGSDIDGPNRSIRGGGRALVYRFEFVGRTVGPPADAEHDAYHRHEICRIWFDDPFSR
jgi:uncharacterized protein YecT (DUF1311 family)